MEGPCPCISTISNLWVGDSGRAEGETVAERRGDDVCALQILSIRSLTYFVPGSVGDADNFRFYHTPGIGWRWPLKFRRVPTTQKGPTARFIIQMSVSDRCLGLLNQTIHIRIAGVDAPEVGITDFGDEAIADVFSGEPFRTTSAAV